MTPIPALLASAPMGEENAPGVDLVPVVQARITTSNTLTAADDGLLYLFINGYLWRELQIVSDSGNVSSFRDVNLITEQGKDTRRATGKAQDSVIWVPKLINDEAVDLSIGYSNEQWNWD